MMTCRPIELGGLGISDLQRIGWALRMRWLWLWLKKTKPDRPWSSFLVQVHSCVSYFSMAVCTVVGNGSRTLFWTDRWIHGQKIEDLAPLLFALVAKRRANKRTVLETLTDNTWIGDLQGALSVGVLAKFLNLWVILSQVVLQPQSEDSTAKSAYEGLFQGSVFGEPGLLTNAIFS